MNAKLEQWKPMAVGDLLSSVIDYRGKTPPKADSGIPCLSAANIKGGVVTIRDKFVTREVYKKWTTRGFIKPGDVLITTEAPVAEVALVPGDQTYLITRRVMALQVDPSEADGRFLMYSLLHENNKKKLEVLSHGATVPRLYKEDILEFILLTPPLFIQYKIASILSAYDDLIENNLRRIKILEEMAQNLYREWFVKFRFPGHEKVKFVVSPLGMIPEGWEIVQLADVADINKVSIRKNKTPDSIVYVDIKSVSTGRMDEIKQIPFSSAPGRAKRIVQHGDTIWSTVRPNRRSYCLIMDPPQNMIVSTGFAVISAKKIPYTYCYHLVTSDVFADYLTGRAKGSAYPAVSTGDFKSVEILKADTYLLRKFHDSVKPIEILKTTLLNMNRNLCQTRDLLLPRLISGELDVSDLDIVIPEDTA